MSQIKDQDKVKVKVKSLSLTLCNPKSLVDCSPPGSFVNGIFQARVLEWVAIAFSEVRLLVVKSLNFLQRKIYFILKKAMLKNSKINLM